MTNNDDNGDLPDLSNRELLRVLMQEIVDMRNELRQDFKQDIDRLEKKIDTVGSEVHILRLEVHQNQTTFIKNHESLENRVTVLEMAA